MQRKLQYLQEHPCRENGAGANALLVLQGFTARSQSTGTPSDYHVLYNNVPNLYTVKKTHNVPYLG